MIAKNRRRLYKKTVKFAKDWDDEEAIAEHIAKDKRGSRVVVVVEVAEEDAEYMKAETHEEDKCGHGLAVNYPTIVEKQKIKGVGINEEEQKIKEVGINMESEKTVSTKHDDEDSKTTNNQNTMEDEKR